MDDWDSFIETCTDEQYTDCAVVIDGESFRNVAIRAKGNTSLSSVAAYGNVIMMQQILSICLLVAI